MNDPSLGKGGTLYRKREEPASAHSNSHFGAAAPVAPSWRQPDGVKAYAKIKIALRQLKNAPGEEGGGAAEFRYDVTAIWTFRRNSIGETPNVLRNRRPK